MPKSLSALLTWGGAVVSVVFAFALVWVEIFGRLLGGTEFMEPVVLYWVFLVVGAVAAIAGFVLDRRKGSSASKKSPLGPRPR